MLVLNKHRAGLKVLLIISVVSTYIITGISWLAICAIRIEESLFNFFFLLSGVYFLHKYQVIVCIYPVKLM